MKEIIDKAMNPANALEYIAANKAFQLFMLVVSLIILFSWVVRRRRVRREQPHWRKVMWWLMILVLWFFAAFTTGREPLTGKWFYIPIILVTAVVAFLITHLLSPFCREHTRTMLARMGMKLGRGSGLETQEEGNEAYLTYNDERDYDVYCYMVVLAVLWCLLFAEVLSLIGLFQALIIMGVLFGIAVRQIIYGLVLCRDIGRDAEGDEEAEWKLSQRINRRTTSL